MIVQACINGARAAEFHPALPLAPDDMARDCAVCVSRGAAEIHLHSRAPDGRESLDPMAMDVTIRAVRETCPGTLIGVSTGAWIENSAQRTLDHIARWERLPDYASVNLEEPAAPEVMEQLARRGIGIEAGLASIGDAERLARLDRGKSALRVLVEIGEQDLGAALTLADDIVGVLRRVGNRRPVLLHGFDATVWRFVERAKERRFSTRVGLEDGRRLPDGAIAPDNAALVAAAVGLFGDRSLPR